MPNFYDTCLCGHPYSYHDPTSNLCRFVSLDPTKSCGCSGFVIPGASLNVPADPTLSSDGDN